jgi:hypothetical protein
MSRLKAALTRHGAFLALLALFALAMLVAPAAMRPDRAARGARPPEDPQRRTLGPRPTSAPLQWRTPGASPTGT